METPQNKPEIVYKGLAASPGVAHGKPFVYVVKELDLPSYEVPEEKRAEEIGRFEHALLETRRQITHIRGEVAQKLGEEEANIFDAHLLVLEDVALIDETIRELRETGRNVERCFHSVSQRYIDAFGMLDDPYIKERVMDIRDVARRVLSVMTGQAGLGLNQIGYECILVAEDVTPSDAAMFEKGLIRGLTTDSGGRTSHAVIMARSLQVPAVVGLHDLSGKVGPEDHVLVDGYEGLVIVNPTRDTLYGYGQYQKERQSIQRVFDSVRDKPAETPDGVRVGLLTNVGSVQEVEQALGFGAEGVGLFRTESLFVGKDAFPGEEEQFQVYRAVAEQMGGRPVIIRTLDIGGDKRMADGLGPKEDNPFMGMRAIRFCLEHPGVFKDQLRAILRAAAHGDVRVMYPMISGVEELLQANRMLDEARQELVAAGVPHRGEITIGCMIEVPGAALTAESLAEHCRFFSIGTNDLIQYTLAVDRVNDRIAHLYEPCHPAVLRLIQRVVEVSRERGMEVGVCGEMASEPMFVPLLVGLGIRELSMSAVSLPEVRFLLRRLRMEDARVLAEAALKESSPRVIQKMTKDCYARLMGDVFGTRG